MPKGKGTYGSQVGRPPKKAGKKAGKKVGKKAGPKDTYERQFGIKPQSLQDYKDWETMRDIKKYQGGGEVGMSYDPFSSKNPEGIAVEQASEVAEEKNDQAQLQKFVKEAGGAPPTANAQERSKTYQMGGEILDYKEGGKVDITDVLKAPPSKKEKLAKQVLKGKKGKKGSKTVVEIHIIDLQDIISGKKGT